MSENGQMEETTMRTTCLRTASAAALVAAVLVGPAAAGDAFDIDALVEAARAEPPITIYDSTGKIVEMAENFTAKYGVQATGEKVSASSQLEMIIREAQAKNVLGDVVLITDAPAGLAQLLPFLRRLAQLVGEVLQRGVAWRRREPQRGLRGDRHPEKKRQDNDVFHGALQRTVGFSAGRSA